MAKEKYFPFRSVSGDRKYSAEDWATYFAQFIGNGVFYSSADKLKVTEYDGMKVKVHKGAGFIAGRMYLLEEDTTITLEMADGVLNRIDRIVLRCDYDNRLMTITAKKGSYSENPTAPELTRGAGVYELALADVYVAAGAVTITAANITDQRFNTSLCGIVTGLVEQADTEEIFSQFQAAFEEWFEYVKAVLDEDATGNLLKQINTKANNSDLQAEVATRKAEVAVERARIDALTKMEPGSTMGDAELQDIRIGADGVTYETAGAAVRAQVTNMESKIDKEVTSLKSDLSELNTNLESFTNVVITTDNKFDGLFDESGYIDGNGNQDSTMFKRTSKVYEIGEHENLLHIALSETVGSFVCVVYDKNMNYLSTASCNNKTYMSVQIYPQSAFFRVYTYTNFNGSMYVSGIEPSDPVDFTYGTKTLVKADNIEQPIDPPFTAQFTNTLKGKNITCFGDSLAANCYTGSVKRWINRVGEYFECGKIYNRGVGGSAVSAIGANGVERNNYASFNEEGEAYLLISYSTSNVPTGIPDNYTQKKASMELDERVNTIPLDTDILLIEAGTNDNDIEVDALSAAYDRMLVKIQNRLPNAKIVIVGLPFTNPSVYMNDEMRIAFRNKLESLMVGIREVAKKYGIPVIELRDTAQVNLINYKNYLSTDGLHYDTESGTKRWAEAVIKGLLGMTIL